MLHHETEELVIVAVTLAQEEIDNIHLLSAGVIGWAAGEAIGSIRRELREVLNVISAGPYTQMEEFLETLWAGVSEENIICKYLAEHLQNAEKIMKADQTIPRPATNTI